MGALLVFEDESGQGLRPPKGRTWGRRGRTPVVRVPAANSPRLSLAALVAAETGHRPRLTCRTHSSRRRGSGRRKGFAEADYARLHLWPDCDEATRAVLRSRPGSTIT